MQFRVGYHRQPDGTVVVRVCGDIDMAVEDEFRRALTEMLAGPPPRAVVVDARELRFIDCTGVRALMQAHACAARAGTRLTVWQPQPVVSRVLHILGLAQTLGLLPPAAAG